MRILQIGATEREAIKKLMAYADLNTISLEAIKKTISGGMPGIGDNEDHVLYLHEGFRVVFSYEEQPVGKCAHISISVDDPNKLPHPEAVKMIMAEFGMGTIEDAINTWAEEGHAINVLTQEWTAERPCEENQWLCEVHHFLMPDGHCTCDEERAKFQKLTQRGEHEKQ